VDVGSPALDGFGNELVHIADDGRFLFGYAFFVARIKSLDVAGVFGRTLRAEDVAVGVHAVVLVDCALDVGGGRNADVDWHPDDVAEVVHNIHIHRVDNRKLELTRGNRHGEHIVLAGVFPRYELFYVVVYGEVLERNERHVELVCEHERNVVVLAILAFDEQVDNFSVYIGGCGVLCQKLLAGVRDNVGGHKPLFFHQLQYKIVCGCHQYLRCV